MFSIATCRAAARVPALVLALMATGGALAQAPAQNARHPVIAGYGAINPIGDAANLPDPALRYRVAFEVTRAADDPAAINPALDRVARFVNLLGAAGVRPAPGDIVIVVHGAATPSVMTDAGYQARFQKANPNTPLIAALRRAGVSVHVCGYALASRKIAREAVSSDVTIDLAAMVTLANLQLRGWAVLPG